MQQYAGIVRAALGIDDARGDKVEIINLRFAGAPVVDGEGGLGRNSSASIPVSFSVLLRLSYSRSSAC